jgi:tetratricopeptide (TPR) repeat protein
MSESQGRDECNHDIANPMESDTSEALYQEGLKYYQSENYPQALTYFQKAAEQNYSEALQILGIMYGYAYGVPRDHKMVIRFLIDAYIRAPSEAKREEYISENHDILMTVCRDLFKHCCHLQQHISHLTQEKQVLEHKNQDLQTQLDFVPGGPGFEQTHHHFEMLVQQSMLLP